MNEFGERWSFIWLVIITLDIVLGAFLISDTLTNKVADEVLVTVETFTSHDVKVTEHKSSEHVEELETGLLINAEELEILARIIHGESGSNWCSDNFA